MNAPIEQPITLPGTRVCKRCGWARRYPDGFHKHPGYRDGRNKVCAECCNKETRQRPERARRMSVAREMELEALASKRESERAAKATAAAFDRLRANTEAALVRRPDSGRALTRWESASGVADPSESRTPLLTGGADV